MDQVKKLFKDALKAAKTCSYCINCKHSYFHPDGYDGYCKYTREEGNGITYMHLKSITTFEVCDHWEKKDE